MSERVACEVVDGVAHVRLDRGDAGNGIDMEMVLGLQAAVGFCETADARAVLITAAGNAFTVGGDLDWIGAQAHRLDEELLAMIGPFHDTLARFSELPVPVVCAAQGPVAGGGIGLLYCADLVLAADNLKIVTGFALLGLSGDGGGTFYLPRLIGTRRAFEVYLENRPITAAEALDWGLVNRVLPREQLEDEAWTVARRLAAGPTAAFAEMRRLIRTSSDRTLREQLAAETEAMKRVGATADAAAAIPAFVRKERPSFEGR